MIYDLEVDWIKLYDKDDSLRATEDFNDCSWVFPTLPSNCSDSCLEVFTRYFNWNLKTHFNYGEIRQMMDSCQIDFDPCDFTGPTLCGKNEPDNAWINAQPNDCADTSDWATMIATQLETIYRDSLVHDFNEAYTKKCLNVQGLEQFSITKPVSEYHYTLYYYDQAGNLVKTIPPEGVHPVRDTSWLRQVREKRDSGLVLVPDHSLPTVYRYNSLNQVVSQKSPDGGRSEFWYDRLGRLVISQNAKQRANENYSYTRYDFIGRIVEVGQKHQVIGMNQAISRNPADLQHWIDFRDYDNAYWPTMVTLTGYDVPSEFASAYQSMPFSQNPYTLRNRVSFSRYFDQLQVNSSVVGADTVYAPLYLWHNTSIEYSYDIHGNVDSMLNIAFVGSIMSSFGHDAFKMITYQYDLISGKVNEVHYQPGFADEFYHRYEYDADNRLTDVYTTDNKAFLKQPGLEEHDAHYEYYRHGPLARTVLGQQQVQGLDYAYTLQGWLKGVNSTALNPDYDMGSDGQVGGINSHVARDAYGFNLNYFTGEYTAINGSNSFPGHTAFMTSGYDSLYNGNISSMAVNIGKFNQPQLYNYKYDQLNRITKMDVYRGLNETTNSWSSLAATTDYQERVAYDGNGNILKYLRKGTGSPLDMDSLNYHYNEGTNQLNHVRDSVSSSNYTVDIDDQPVNNYRYDEIGNLIKDSTEELNIEWNVYGKISKIFKTPHVAGDATEIDYHYDPNGNRVGKTLFKYSAKSEQLWYVRDAQGNVMAVYDFYYNLDFSPGPLKLIEHHIYGSSRLGIVRRDQDMDSMKVDPVNANLVGATYLYQTERGKKLYELSNHLGNVLVTISDRKLGHDDGTGNYDYYTADVVNANDYYPFGMMMPGRQFSDSSLYRYGFNGKENDNEVKGDNNLIDYGERVYDPRTCRFYSVDPIFKDYAELSTYQYGSNNPIFNIDLDGLEGTGGTAQAIKQTGTTVLKAVTKNGVEKGAKVVAMKAAENPGFWSRTLPWLGRAIGVGGWLLTPLDAGPNVPHGDEMYYSYPYEKFRKLYPDDPPRPLDKFRIDPSPKKPESPLPKTEAIPKGNDKDKKSDDLASVRFQVQTGNTNLSSNTKINSADIGVTKKQGYEALNTIFFDAIETDPSLKDSKDFANAVINLSLKIKAINGGLSKGIFQTTLQELFVHKNKLYRIDVEVQRGHNFVQ